MDEVSLPSIKRLETPLFEKKRDKKLELKKLSSLQKIPEMSIT